MTSPVISGITPEQEGVTPKPLSTGRVFGYSLANLGNGAFYAFNNAALPLWLLSFTHNAILLGFMAGTHSFEGAIIQPLIGAWSDRLWSRWGRRLPFMLVFVPLSALLLLITPLCAHLPAAVRLTAIVTCIFLSTVAFNIAADPYQALLADITTPTQRGRATGVWFFMGALGQVAVLLVPLPLGVKFTLVGLLLIIMTGITCAVTREPPLPVPTATVDATHRRTEIRNNLQGMRTLHQARIYLLMFFFYGAGVDAVLPNLTLFIHHITHCSNAQAQQMFTVLMASVAVGTVPMGLLSDRLGFKRLLILSFILIAAAAALGLHVDTLGQVGLVLALAGLGVAAQNASAFPLLTRLVPPQEIGFYTGLQTTAVSIAGPLAVWLTGILINHGGYRVIFGVCAVCIIIALVTLLRLMPELAVSEITARDLQQESL